MGPTLYMLRLYFYSVKFERPGFTFTMLCLVYETRLHRHLTQQPRPATICITHQQIHGRRNRHYNVQSHLDKRNTQVRTGLINYSSAFNTIVPSKLSALGLNPSLCTWVLDLLTSQVVKVGNNISAMLIFNMGAPQGCVLSPLLYYLFTHNCVATQFYNSESPGRVVPGK